MSIVKDLRNGLLKRREVSVIIEKEKNPGFDLSGKTISEKFKADLEKIKVKNVYSKFGSKEFLVNAMIYDSIEDMNNIEMKEKKKGEKKK